MEEARTERSKQSCLAYLYQIFTYSSHEASRAGTIQHVYGGPSWFPNDYCGLYTYAQPLALQAGMNSNQFDLTKP